MIVKMITPSTNKALGIATGMYPKPDWVVDTEIIEFEKFISKIDNQLSGEVCWGIWDQALAAQIDYTHQDVQQAFDEWNMDVFAQTWSSSAEDGYKNYYDIEHIAKASFRKKWKVMYPDTELTDSTIICVFSFEMAERQIWDPNKDLFFCYGIDLDHPYRLFLTSSP